MECEYQQQQQHKASIVLIIKYMKTQSSASIESYDTWLILLLLNKNKKIIFKTFFPGQMCFNAALGYC